MIRPFVFMAAFLLSFSTSWSQGEAGMTNFDDGWKFFRGGYLGAEAVEFNDSAWRMIDLPHDWSIEDQPGTSSPFNPAAISQVSGGFTCQGTAWYRKTFFVANALKLQTTIIQFDGVYMNASVYVNGTLVATHPYGYTSFYIDIGAYLRFDAKNVIAVEVKNEGQNSRWYSGSGIYRHVWLKTCSPVHLKHWGTFISTHFSNSDAAHVHIRQAVINDGKANADLRVVTDIQDASGATVANVKINLSVHAGQGVPLLAETTIANPQLWSCDVPNLYTAITRVFQDGRVTDSSVNIFGIRRLSFDAESGFRLNGKVLKLKGGCFHNDNGPLGSKAYDRAEERKVELLKAGGFNAVRCSHNPPSDAFLNHCDRLGILVIDEAFDMWAIGKNPYDYHLYFKDEWKHDLEAMVSRDRNHPCIIMWSIGNEIPEKADSSGVATAYLLARFVKSLDTTRPVTAAVNDLNSNKDPFFAALDVAGYNYAAGGDHHQPDIYQQDHIRIPRRIMFGSESYPLEAFDAWKMVKDHPYVIGDFVWTALDYIGEASIGWRGYPQEKDFFPWNLAFCGDIDICGWKRPQSYYRDALWQSNQLSLFVNPPAPSFALNPNIASWSKWNWLDAVDEWTWSGNENKPLEVSAYSSCERVELFLNGKSLGSKSTNASVRNLATWNVPYHTGILKALGYSGKKLVATSVLRTAGKAVALRLSADRTAVRANNQDLSYVTVQVVDENGLPVPSAENLIRFSLQGNGTIAGVGNANPVSLESFQQPHRKAWKGRCLVIIKAGKNEGSLILKAESDDLKSSELIIAQN